MLSKQHIQTLIDQASQDITRFLGQHAKINWTVWAEKEVWTVVIQATESFNTFTSQKQGEDIEHIFEQLSKDIIKQIGDREVKVSA
jgi:uncharacterized protein (DUF302 family)